MFKTLLTLFGGLMMCQMAMAQVTGDSTIYMKNSGMSVSSKDGADYYMVFHKGDSSTGVWAYPVNQFYINGKSKMTGYSITMSQYLQLTGSVAYFYQNGNKKSNALYKNGLPTGNVVHYYPNGQLWKMIIENNETIDKEGQIKHITLLQTCSDSTGKVLAENGIGTWVDFDEDFKYKIAEGKIINGLKEGEWQGVLSDTTGFNCIYKNGELLGTGYGYDKTGKKYPFNKIEVIPEFPKGLSAFGRFLSKNVRFPSIDLKKRVFGRVVTAFTVQKDGTLTDITALSAPSPTLAAEAIRVLKLSPTWTPGYQYGFPVNVTYFVPIGFNAD